MLERAPRTKTVLVAFSEPINQALESAMADFRLIKTKLVERATIEFLKKHHFLDSEGNVVKRSPVESE